MIDYGAPALETGVATLWPPCWSATRDQRIIRIDGLARGTVWDGTSAAPDDLGITAPEPGLTVTTPTGGGAIAGTYQCAIRYKDKTHGTYSCLSELVEVTAADGDKFSWTVIPVSPEPRVTHIELWRTTADQAEKLYLIATLPNSGTPTFSTDTEDDDTLGLKDIDEQLKIYAADGKSLSARRQVPPPDFMRVVVNFQGRTFYAVPAVYSEGTVTSEASEIEDGYLLSGEDIIPEGRLGIYEAAGTHNTLPYYTFTNDDAETFYLWADPDYSTLIGEDPNIVWWWLTDTLHADATLSYSWTLFHAGRSTGTAPPAQLQWYTGASGIIDVEEYSGATITLQGNGTNWTAEMEGRKLYIDGVSTPYTIQSVDVVNQTLVIVGAYSGAALVAASYFIVPSLEDYSDIALYSEIDEPESVPADQNQLRFQDNTGPDDDYLVGLMPHGSILWGLKSRHTYIATYARNPLYDGNVRLAFSRGCLNQRCWGFIGDSAYLMDSRGPWRIGDSGSLDDIADGRIKNYWRDKLLDFGKSEWWFISCDPNEEIVRFHVTLMGQTGTRPKTAFCYAPARNEWWVDTDREATSGCAQVNVMARPRLLLGGQYGRILMAGEGTSDCCSYAAIAAGNYPAGYGLIVDADAQPFNASMIGYEVEIVRGTGKGQVRTITGFGTHSTFVTTYYKLTVSEAWDTNPDATTGFVVRYAIRGTCTAGAASSFTDSTLTGTEQLAGASVAIVSGTGAGQVRQIKNYEGSGVFSITEAWTTTPDTTSVYLIGGIRCRMLTGLYPIPPVDLRGPSPAQRTDERAVILAWTPTDEDAGMQLRIYKNHDASPETIGYGYTDLELSAVKGNEYTTLDLKRGRSSLGEEAGWARMQVRLQAKKRVPGTYWFAADMIWYQAEEEIHLHSLGLEGVSG